MKPEVPWEQRKASLLTSRKAYETSHRQSPSSAIGALGQALVSSDQASLNHKGCAGLLPTGKRIPSSEVDSALKLGKVSTHGQAVCPPVAACMQYMKLPSNVPGLCSGQQSI